MMRDPHELLQPSVRRPALQWVLCLVCVAVAFVAGWEAWRLTAHTRVSQAALLQLQQRRLVVPPPKPSKAEVDAQTRWGALATERAFNWYPIFRALEETASADIELLEFVPDKVGGRLMLRGEARDAEALIRFLSALAAQGSFDEVHLAHQKAAPRAGIPIIDFEIRAMLAPALVVQK